MKIILDYFSDVLIFVIRITSFEVFKLLYLTLNKGISEFYSATLHHLV
jgi:hypothetical protein